jgi:hypothetical protein
LITSSELSRLFRYDKAFIHPDLREVTAGFDPDRPDWDLADRQGLSRILREPASDIFVFPFVTEEWCALCIELADTTAPISTRKVG